MTVELDLLRTIVDVLPYATNTIEESRRLTIEGDALNGLSRQGIARVLDVAGDHCNSIVLFVDEQDICIEDLSDATLEGYPWRIVFSKNPLAEKMRARNGEDTLLFFSLDGFHKWLGAIDPFSHPQGSEPDFSNPTTIRVYGLRHGFGGQMLWVLPVNAGLPEIPTVALPATSEVHGLIHVNAVGKSLRVCPRGFALTWGINDDDASGAMMVMSALVLSACLVQELKQVDGRYEATLRGAKRVTLQLVAPNQRVTAATLNKLIEAVSWVYGERPETRLRLVMDRLSIESQTEDTLIFCMEEHLDAALQQARDSYAFVILERKDAYHKEMRELMKDMKAQADLYAAKVRDLVASLTRDVLGILVFIGFSFIGKFDQKNLQGLLASEELSLLVKFLAGYLALSCVLQLLTHWRDASLAYKESQKWLDSLQNYTSKKDKQETFLELLNKRRNSLRVAMWVVAGFYAALAYVTWNLPCVVELLLAK